MEKITFIFKDHNESSFQRAETNLHFVKNEYLKMYHNGDTRTRVHIDDLRNIVDFVENHLNYLVDDEELLKLFKKYYADDLYIVLNDDTFIENNLFIKLIKIVISQYETYETV